jgi:hypothetical protein
MGKLKIEIVFADVLRNGTGEELAFRRVGWGL